MRALLITIASLTLASSLLAQSEQQGKQKKSKKEKELPSQVELVPHEAAPIFTGEEPIAFTLTANYDRLRHDRKQEAPWRWASVTVADSAAGNVELPLKVRTRGIWRLNQCDLPPLRLDFAKGTVKHTAFSKLDKPKLVMHCRDNDDYEQYVLQEFQLYRIYNLLTKYSNRVRLARVTYADSGSGKVLARRWAFLEEEPNAVAYRVGGMLVKQKGAGPGDLDPNADALFAIFQYFIGNTDWSVNGLHNVELIETALGYVPVAYDFDFSGAVNARYAVTDPSLPIRRVRDRLYRGYCVPEESYAPAFEQFNAKKDSIYALYRDSLGQLLKGDRVKETLEYFDDFYKTINDPRVAKHEIKDRCLSGSR